MGLTQITTGGVDDNINIDSNTLKVDGTNNRIGIGTAAPVKQLHIHNSSATEAQIQLTDSGTGSTVSDGMRVGWNGTLGQIYVFENADLRFATNDTERLRLTNDGKLGVGLSSPATALHVQANVDNDAARVNNTDATNGYGFSIRGGGTAAGRYCLRVANEANTVVLQANANGNVGVGTAAAADQLHIHEPSSGAANVRFSSNDVSNGFFVGFDGQEQAQIWHTANKPLRFATNNTERLRIESDGRIKATTSGLYVQTSNSGSGNTDGLALHVDGNEDAYLWNYENTSLRFGTNNTERARITNAGKFLINTSYPSGYADRLLTVGDTSLSSSTIEIRSATNGWGGFAFSDSTAGDVNSYRGTIEYSHSTNHMQIRTNAVERLRIDDSGRIGIKNSSPGSQYFNDLVIGDGTSDHGITLHTSTTGSSAIAFSDSTSGTGRYAGYIQYDHTSNSMRFYTNGGNERARFTENGYFKASNTASYYNSGASYHEFNQSINAQNSIFRSTNSSYSASQVQFGVARAATSAYWFLQGISSFAGTNDTEFYIRGDSYAYIDGAWNGGGADYAEYFEWSDGNTEAEDRRGISVVLDGDKIREAVEGEEPIGVISGNPSVVGDADVDRWKGKYLRDDYGSYVLDEDGYRQLNPDYDSSLEYVQREDRPEWDTVGLMGKLRIRKGQVTGARWIKMRDVSSSVEEWLVR